MQNTSVSGAYRVPRSRPSRLQQSLRAVVPYLYVAPAVVLVSGLLLYSVVYTVGISFTDWNLVAAPRFVGFDKYLKVISDPVFGRSFINTLMWTAGTLILPVFFGLLLAAGLERVPGQRIWKVFIYLPNVLAATVIGVIWSYIYADGGVLNSVLKLLGLDHLTRPWLVIPPINTWSMILTSTWRALGPSMVLFLVGLQTIPSEIIEAGKLDGASEWVLFRHIKLPLLKPILVVVVTMAIINSFTTFDLVWVMTQGGPYRSSETLAVTMYRQAFIQWDMGYSAALAVILSLIVLAFSIVYLRRTFAQDS